MEGQAVTISDKTTDELWDRLELLALTEEEIGRRQDVTTLLKFHDDGCNPLYLFWDFYRPECIDRAEHTGPTHSEELEGMVMNLLHCLYDRHRLPYEPDQGQVISRYLEYLEALDDALFHQGDQDIPEDITSEEFCRSITLPPDFRDLLIFLHVAAARAFLLKRRHGYSDEVRVCLKEVERTIEHLKLVGLDMELMFQHSIGIFQSVYAVSAMSFAELGRISHIEGRYTEALHYFAKADEYYEPSAYPTDNYEDWPFEWIFLAYSLDEESPGPYLSDRIVEYRFDSFRAEGLCVSLKEIVSVFRSISGQQRP